MNLKQINVYMQLDLLTNSDVNVVMNRTKKITPHFSNISISANWIKSFNTDDLTTTKVKTIIYPLIAERRFVVIGKVRHRPLHVTVEYSI